MSSEGRTSFSGVFGSHVRDGGRGQGQQVQGRNQGLWIDDDTVFHDPDWFMEQEPADRGQANPATKIGSFAAFAGMSPSLGVPPVDCFFFPASPPVQQGNHTGGSNTSTPAPVSRRKRHFSLEDCQDELFDQDSSSCSNDSGFFLGNEGKRNKNPGVLALGDVSMENSNQENDLKPITSFINDMSYPLDLNLDLSTDDASNSLRTEFESRLLHLVEACDQVQVTFPQGLLQVIAGHVLQEASGEPYGLKGCVLHIQYEGQTALHHLATLDCDPCTLAKTFELTLTLRQAQTSWGQRMARRLSFSSSPMAVSTSYKLVKRRKYRGNSHE